jgi:hypothetical protein
MPDVERVKEELTRELKVLEFEILTLARVFAETSFFGHVRNFPNAHHGYLMTCMGRIDVLSSYWSGRVGSRGQTQRMILFMDRYLHPGRIEEHRVAVQMFRHTLMHTGALQFLYNRTTDTRYTRRVYFGEGLRPEWHYRITTEDEQYQEQLRALPVSTGSANSVIKALNVSITRFIGDLSHALQVFLTEFEADASLQANYDNAHPQIVIQEFRP